jgi:uncharacterized membrane protein
MTDASHSPIAPSKVPAINTMQATDIAYALRRGTADYWAKPMMGLFFSLIYVLGGWAIYIFVIVIDQIWWAIPITVGFPLLGPFLAVGLYEVSRRLEAGEDWQRRDIFSVVWRQKDRQIPSMAWVIVVFFLFWTFFAHMLFALFLGPSAMMNISSSYAYLFEPAGLTMVLVGTAFGAVFALILFSLTVISLPLLLDKELDFVTAMLTSLAVVRHNWVVMISWGLIIATATFVGILTGFLGLFVVLPVLGHASWHIYRRALTSRD